MEPHTAVKTLNDRGWTYLRIAIRVDSTPGTVYRVGTGKDCMHALATKLIALAESGELPEKKAA
jgi:hypothetical protein